MEEIWVVGFSDDHHCINGMSAYFGTKEQAKEFFDKEKVSVREDYKNEVDYWDEDEDNLVGYADAFANDTVCTMSVYPMKLDGKWHDNLEW